MRYSRVAALATSIFVVASAFTSAQAGPLDPSFQKQTVYFHCSGSTRAGNVNLLAGEGVPSWNTSPPPGSVTGQNGCLTADVLTPIAIEPEENPADGVWKGTFRGNLDTLTVNAHQMLGDGWALDAEEGADIAGLYVIRLRVDGQQLVNTEAAPVEINGTSENSGATNLITFSIRNLGLIEPNLDTNGDGIGDNKFGKIEHTITLNLNSVSAAFDMWAYDTSEVESGITFNPTPLLGPIVDATVTASPAGRHHRYGPARSFR